MQLSGLSFNALPDIDLPFRFFISAPIFVIACAILILFSGESLWVSRWHPHMLALTHGFTLGFLTMVMMGALLQLLPVIGGIGIPRPRLIAVTSHTLLSLGIICLMLGFMSAQTWLLISAMGLLTISLGIFITALFWVLIKKLSQGDSIIGFRLAISALAIVLLLGFSLLSRSLGMEIIPADKHITDIHALWGLAGWASLLIIAVSYQVIPMFHVAPSFPALVRKYLSSSLFLLLVLFIFAPQLAMPLLVIAHGIFAISILVTISKRKRKIPDTSIRYWQLASFSLLVMAILYFVPDTIWSQFCSQDKTTLLATAFIYFYLISIIQGMLLKILPFLSYTHLQQSCLINLEAMQYIPHMHEFLNKKHGRGLYYLHIVSGFALLLVLIKPSFYFVFAWLILLEFTWLLILMSRTMRLYFEIHKKISTL